VPDAGVVDVHYTLEGDPDAPPLVLSNALGSTIEIWRLQAAALRRSFRLVCYDHRA
jgi:3-oxoadipate enol-lactonase